MFLKKSVDELTVLEENKVMSTKGLQNCKVLFKSDQQDLSTFKQNLEDLGGNSTISRISNYFTVQEEDQWRRMDIGKLSHLFRNTVRELRVNRENYTLLREMDVRDLYLHRLTLNSD